MGEVLLASSDCILSPSSLSSYLQQLVTNIHIIPIQQQRMRQIGLNSGWGSFLFSPEAQIVPRTATGCGDQLSPWCLETGGHMGVFAGWTTKWISAVLFVSPCTPQKRRTPAKKQPHLARRQCFKLSWLLPPQVELNTGLRSYKVALKKQ